MKGIMMKFNDFKCFIYVCVVLFSSSSFAQQLAIPSYFYPDSANCEDRSTCYWKQLDERAGAVGIVIINPNSGVGSSLDSNYLEQTKTSQEKGIKVLGYVYTQYTNRDINVIKNEIDKYFQWYSVDGIFLDEGSNTCNDIDFYSELNEYIKAKSSNNGSTVILNPGTKTEECYLSVADILLTFEGSYEKYKNNWLPLTWESDFPENRFWHLVYNTNKPEMLNTLALSKQRNVEYIYVTDDILDNPWDTIPNNSYWDAELGALGFEPECIKPEPIVYKNGILYIPEVDAGALGKYKNVEVSIERVYKAEKID
jgi:hypothetical protein